MLASEVSRYHHPLCQDCRRLETATCFLCEGDFQMRVGEKNRHRNPVCKSCWDEESNLVCDDCGEEFDFPVKDRVYYKEKGYSEPKRCENCRQNKKDTRRTSDTVAEYRSCVDCDQSFAITVGQRQFCDRKCLSYPKRCQSCRKNKKDSGG